MGLRPGKLAFNKLEKVCGRIISEPYEKSKIVRVSFEAVGGISSEIAITDLITLEMLPDIMKHLQKLPDNGNFVGEIRQSLRDTILFLEGLRNDSLEQSRVGV